MATGSDAVGSLCGIFMCFGPFGLFVLLIIVLIVLGAIWGYYASMGRTNAMRQFATENGMAMSGGGFFSMPSLSGSYKGHNTQMGYFQRTEGGGKHRHTHTYFFSRMMTNTSPMFALSLSKEGMFSWIGKSVGVTHEIQVGDEAFDKEYLINTNDALRAKRVLAPEVRTMIDGLFDSFRMGSLNLETGALYIQREMSNVGYPDLKMVAEAMAGLAEAVDKY